MESHETLEGVQEVNFVRKAFYLEPPAKGATVEVWEAWMQADKDMARADKARHTRSLKHAEVPETGQAKSVTKIGGVYRQSALVGFVGDAEQGTAQVEAAVEAKQDRMIMQRHTVGGQKRSKNGNRKRAKAKEQRRLRKGQLAKSSYAWTRK